jgi:hypothetical protein
MEPERRIEKLLRAFAKKRREQAGDPMELHPAMRQQLQKEIARRQTGTGGGGWLSSFFLGLRPKLVFAVCFVALAVGGWIFLANLNGPKPASLASANYERDELAPAKKTAPATLAPASPPITTVAPPVVAEDKDALKNKPQTVFENPTLKSDQLTVAGENRKVVPPPGEKAMEVDVITNGIAQFDASTGVSTASAAPSDRENLAFKSNRAFGGGGVGGGASADAISKNATEPALPGLASATTATFAANQDTRKSETQKQLVPAASASVGSAFSDKSKSEIAATTPPASHLFLNRLDMPVARQRPTASLIAPAPVLASFRVEQTGNAMRIIDADGSVYTGAVQVAEQEGVTRAVPPKDALPTAQRVQVVGQSQAAQNYFFRVAGTNRQLQQNVVFSGNVMPLTNAPPATGAGAIGGFGGARRAPASPSDPLLSNSRISGKAVIGEQNEIEVNATPAP